MMNKRAFKIIFSFLMIFIFVISGALTAFATADPYGQYPVSPAPKSVVAKWYKISGYNGYEKGDKYFTINTTVNDETMKLYITFPDLGGFRIENEEPSDNPLSVEKTGIFEPSANNKITYKVTAKSVTMSANDGTKLIFSEKSDSWKLEVLNSDNIRLFSITPEQISFGYRSGKVVRNKIEMPLSASESVYGTGERFASLNQNGHRTVMWNSDAAYILPSANNYELWRSYKNIPILHSSRGYTMYYNSFAAANVDIGYTNSKKYTLDFQDDRLDFYIWTGSMKENISSYTELTGMPYIPDAEWAYHYQAGGSNGYWTEGGESTPNAVSQLQRLISSYEEMGTPILTIYGEHSTVSASALANNIVKTNGSVMLRWNNADFCSPATGQDYLPEIEYSSLPFARLEKNPNKFYNNWVDYTDPNGIDLLKKYLKQYTDMGIKGGMCDFAELVQPYTLFSNGLTGDVMHNFYTYFYAKAYNEAYSELTDNNYLCYIRGASAGTQKWTTVWLGDQYASVDGFKMQLRALLSLSTAGFSMMGFDIGGLDGTPSSGLYGRWLQFATFSPIMRSGGNKSKNPTDYSEQLQAAYKKAYWLRENLVDKIKSSAIKSNITGIPMTQPMGLAFEGQLDLYDIENQYLFCDDFLFTAVTADDTYHYEVKLPYGNWYNLYSGEKVTGSQTIDTDAPYNGSPVFVRAGTVAPVKISSDLKLGKAMTDSDSTKALIVTPPDAKRTDVYHSDKNSTTVYTSEPISSSTFSITYDGGNDADSILALGVSAHSVKVDGKTLERLTDKPTDNSKAGFFVDSNSITRIYPGTSDWKKIDITLGKYDDANILSGFNDSEASVLLNDDFNTVLNLSKKSDYELIGTLSEKTYIDSVVLKWTGSYAQSYKVAVSEDGESWTEVVDATERTGGIEKLEFEPITAKYIKLYSIYNDNSTMPTLYGMEVNKPLGYQAVEYDESLSNAVDVSKAETDEDDEIVILKRRRKIKKSTGGNASVLQSWIFWLIAGIASLLLLSGIILMIIILVKRKKKKEEAAAEVISAADDKLNE